MPCQKKYGQLIDDFFATEGHIFAVARINHCLRKIDKYFSLRIQRQPIIQQIGQQSSERGGIPQQCGAGHGWRARITGEHILQLELRTVFLKRGKGLKHGTSPYGTNRC